MSDDFVNHPVRKLLNRENIFSRVDKLEKQNGAQPSARVAQLGQMSQNTGNLVVDGTIEIIDRDNGGTSVTIFDGGVTIVNDFTGLSFGVSDPDKSAYLKTDTSDNLWIANRVAGKAVRLIHTLTNENTPGMEWREDTVTDNVSQLHLEQGASGVKLSFGSTNVLWGNSSSASVLGDGLVTIDNGTDKRLEIGADHYIPTRNSSNKTVIFNEAAQGIDLNIQGDADDSLFFADVSTNRIGIGTATPGVKLDIDNGTVRSKLIAGLADDAATSFTPSTTVGGMIVMAATGAGNGGFAGYNTITGTATAMMSGTNFNTTNGTLAGTTSTDTKLTVSAHTDGKIYVENRTGAARNVLILLI